MTLLISKSFSNLIMNSLFRTKVYPVVKTVEDVVNNNNIIVHTSKNIEDFKWFDHFYPSIVDKLINKLNNDKKVFEETDLKHNDELRVKGISEGIFVDFDSEGYTQNTRHRYAGHFPNLYLSDHKYDFKPLALIVGRKHRYSREILALLVYVIRLTYQKLLLIIFTLSFRNGFVECLYLLNQMR